MSRLHIFIAGTDEGNGDESRVAALARTPSKRFDWGGISDAAVGDRVLFCVTGNDARFVAEAVVGGASRRTPRGAWPFTAKLTACRLLRNPLRMTRVCRAFPEWKWATYPRNKVTVPEKHAEALLSLARGPESDVQIAILNSGIGLRSLQQAAGRGGAMATLVPKHTRKGDQVFFYVAAPVSGIMATGVAAAAPTSVGQERFETRVRHIRLLRSPIRLSELRGMFPDWAWLERVVMFSYVRFDRAEALRARCGLKAPPRAESVSRARGGAGFGTAESNKKVEAAAIRLATRQLRSAGYKVVSREADRVGYDLEARKGREELHVEVKGSAGPGVQFFLTTLEYQRARQDKRFLLMVVTEALSKKPILHQFNRDQVETELKFEPSQYRGTRKH